MSRGCLVTILACLALFSVTKFVAEWNEKSEVAKSMPFAVSALAVKFYDEPCNGWTSIYSGRAYILEIPEGVSINQIELGKDGWKPSTLLKLSSDGLATQTGLECLDLGQFYQFDQSDLKRDDSLFRNRGNSADYLIASKNIVVGGFSTMNH